jgi:hypothetical protein
MKIHDLSWNINDVITQDRFLEFSKENNICYIKTDFFYIGKINWRGELHPKSLSKVTFIGHSDFPVTREISEQFDLVFCINKNSECENTFGIPLGITNDCDDSPIHRIYGNLEIMHSVFKENIKKDYLAYINFNVNNFKSERSQVYNLFSNKDWTKIGQIDNTLNGRANYLRDIKSSKFVFCPRGNGIDTHRIWESLYMGSIPVVKYENTHLLFKDLPILFINDWSQINEDFLNSKYEEYIEKDWNLDKLKMKFWKEFIINKLDSLH